ncbi:hypothetical protein [Priestia megaterium]|uniref:hypothetical protein n=1 Tax=Priestia megaterium TaxID=1404 RepID=UPI002E1CDFCD|nr:hypothetical protein [Priestia megaterium]
MILPFENLNNIYEEFKYLVEHVYTICLEEEGNSPTQAAGRTLSELQPMADSEDSKKILYLLMTSYFALQDNQEAFQVLYKKLKTVMESGSIIQLRNELNSMNETNKLEIESNSKVIIKYYDQNFGNDRSTG